MNGRKVIIVFETKFSTVKTPFVPTPSSKVRHRRRCSGHERSVSKRSRRDFDGKRDRIVIKPARSSCRPGARARALQKLNFDNRPSSVRSGTRFFETGALRTLRLMLSSAVNAITTVVDATSAKCYFIGTETNVRVPRKNPSGGFGSPIVFRPSYPVSGYVATLGALAQTHFLRKHRSLI